MSFIKKVKINRWLFFMIISFFVLWFMLKEALGAIMLHKSYEAGMVYGKDTYLLDTRKKDTITYADIKASKIDVSKVELMRVTSSDSDGIQCSCYDIKTDGEPKDDALFSLYEVWIRYLLEILSVRYKDNMYCMYCLNSNISGSEIDYGFIIGPDSLLREGKMCKSNDEIVCVSGHLVGDIVILNGHKYKVTGLLKADVTIPDVPIYLAATEYDIYKRREKDNLVYMFFDFADADYLMSREMCPEQIVFDYSAISEDDRFILEKFGEIRPLSENYGRFSTDYAYALIVLPVLASIISMLLICRYIRSYKI